MPGTHFDPRIVGYVKRSDVPTGLWIVTAAGEELVLKGRYVDRSTISIDVGYQIALPESSEAFPDPMDNTDWFAAQMTKVEAVKALFRGDSGILRDADFAGFNFIGLENLPMYRPDLIHDFQILQSVVRLQMIGEIE